ncbi:tRNA pseudouridine(55) synthase TruB [Silvanigrella paludirubra]|uniref:tRNA pseudouridine synthase B n=1 Tax=Silvanigrella paludirubra TaxID=2499159 RepID=A0A6N6VPY6_9BACT|nr:tRNA pseudouridine(55) synthase TruB [Silvanigrella paludirubra]KAB8037084.1 tRNA pseudouridine(55) synthase TruB [Silvanigrella paludirubra]
MNVTKNIENKGTNKKNLCGLVLIDKAAEINSHKIVSAMRKILNIDKVGHLGTLDPFATGLLPVLIGGATRLSDEIMDGKKQYLFTISLGTETDTLDYSGRVINEEAVPEQFNEKIQENLYQFIGNIEQVPPVYSALKMNGRPLYEYMRATGKLPDSIETKKRIIQIEKINIVSFDLKAKSITLRVLCGKGTYVRSLARDISKSIGTVGHCTQLRREYVEPWSVENAIVFSLDSKISSDQIIEKMISPEEMLPNIPKVVLNEEYHKQLSSGNVIFVSADVLEGKLDLNSLRNGSSYNKIFVSIQNFEFMFYSDIEYIQVNNVFKIMPKKKIN